MIPPVVMYVLAAILGVWGLFRLNMGRRKEAKGRGGHLFFGVLYVLMALYLALTTARVIPPPRFFGGSKPAPSPPQVVQVTPLSKIPQPPRAASQPATAPAPAPASAPAVRP